MLETSPSIRWVWRPSKAAATSSAYSDRGPSMQLHAAAGGEFIATPKSKTATATSNPAGRRRSASPPHHVLDHLPSQNQRAPLRISRSPLPGRLASLHRFSVAGRRQRGEDGDDHHRPYQRVEHRILQRPGSGIGCSGEECSRTNPALPVSPRRSDSIRRKSSRHGRQILQPARKCWQ